MKIDGIYLGLGLMILSAAIVAGVLWFAFALLTSMAQYIPSLP